MLLRTKLTVSALIIGLSGLGSVALGQQAQPNTSAPAIQQPGRVRPAGRGMRRRARVGRLRALRQVNLTDAQRQQARLIRQNHVTGTKAQREEFRKLMTQARAGTLPSEQQARAQQLRQQLMEGRRGAHAQMMNVLTTEQKAKLEEMRQTRRANRERLGRRKPAVEFNGPKTELLQFHYRSEVPHISCNERQAPRPRRRGDQGVSQVMAQVGWRFKSSV